jgi:hypothetical protein
MRVRVIALAGEAKEVKVAAAVVRMHRCVARGLDAQGKFLFQRLADIASSGYTGQEAFSSRFWFVSS